MSISTCIFQCTYHIVAGLSCLVSLGVMPQANCLFYITFTDVNVCVMMILKMSGENLSKVLLLLNLLVTFFTSTDLRFDEDDFYVSKSFLVVVKITNKSLNLNSHCSRNR